MGGRRGDREFSALRWRYATLWGTGQLGGRRCPPAREGGGSERKPTDRPMRKKRKREKEIVVEHGLGRGWESGMAPPDLEEEGEEEEE